jgi:hypothetical protein
MSDLHFMQIPRSGPTMCVVIDASHEQELKQPYVRRRGRVQTVVVLEPKEKQFPLVTKSTCNIVPQSLNASVVDAPAGMQAK